MDDKELSSRERSAKLGEIQHHLDEYAAGNWNKETLKARFGQVRA